MDKKKIGLILLVVGLIFVLINLIVIYPFINCVFAPLVFWLLAVVFAIGGILLYFDIKIFYSEED